MTNQNINAYSHASKRSMVLGNHEWIVTNDTICAAGEESYTATLSLTTCSDEQFTCSDGLCIPIDQRWKTFELQTKVHEDFTITVKKALHWDLLLVESA